MEENKLYRVAKGKYTDFWLGQTVKGLIVNLADLEEYTPPTPLKLEQLGIKIGECLADYDEDRMCGSTNTEAALTFIEKIKPLISLMLQEKDENFKMVVEIALYREKLIGDLKTQLQKREEGVAEMKSDLAIFKELYHKAEERIKELESEKQTTNE